jgi:beta-phosphoglucomutase-like phosphatase (HAD superfamily)
MGIGAVIFDFNGVLVDDESLHFALFQEVLAHEGVMLSEQDYHERYLGYDDRRCFEAALQDAGRAADAASLEALVAEKARRYFQAADRGLRFFPAAAETLAAVATRWPIAICSGALRAEIEYAVRLLGRYNEIAAIISAEDTDKCKPDPEGYQLALAALNAYARNSQTREHASAAQRSISTDLVAADCLVIEDSLAGIVSAKGAGMHTVGLPNTYSELELRRAGADEVVDGLAILTPEWITSRFAS